MYKNTLFNRSISGFFMKKSLPVLFSLQQRGEHWKKIQNLVMKNCERTFGVEEFFIGN